MKTKNKVIAFIVILLVCILFTATIIVKNINKDYIELTQLHDNSPIQMMGYFIKTSNEKIIVIDGGTIEDSSNLQNYINQNGGKVDYWILTHFHTDHTGAISDIINNTDIEIKNIIYHECPIEMVEQYEPARIEQYELIHNALQNERVKDIIIDPTPGQRFQISANIDLYIIDVYENDITNNLGNNTSTVFKININKKSMLFLGDIGEERSEKLLNNHDEELKSDYVQMAHHGQNGATFELYKKVEPHCCLWPTPEWLWNNNSGNGYNTGPFKTIEVREWMKELNVEENYIEKDGDITIMIK